MNFVTGDFAAGTHLVGYVTATRNEIEAVFGSPLIEASFEGKVTTEWGIEFADGTIATIYDWKRYEIGAPRPTEVYEWHIGGHTRASVEAVSAALKIPAEVF